jgi:hypothetical protein
LGSTFAAVVVDKPFLPQRAEAIQKEFQPL